MQYRFLERGGLAAAIAALNEIPLYREKIIETDTGLEKLGDGVTHYNDLPYLTPVDDAIVNGETIRAPSQNAVFDALALKRDTALANGYLWIGNGSGQSAAVLMSGDATISNTGVLALATAQSAAHTWAATQTFTLAPVFTDGPGTRTALGLVIGTNVQAYSLVLTNFASLTLTNDYFLQVKAGAWTARSVAQVKVDLGVDTGAALVTDTDGTLAANSDLRVATQKAVKTYADTAIAAVPPSFVPTLISAGTTFTVPINKQALFAVTIDVQGTLDVIGTLVGV